MYVRAAKKREEVWLLDRLEEFDMADPAFRSRDYVVAVDEDTNEKVGFGRLRVHSGVEPPFCEVTNIGVLPAWREQGVAAHVIERLVDLATDQDFDEVYSLTTEPGYLGQFGFRRVEESSLPGAVAERLAEARETDGEDAVPALLDVDDFTVPDHLRRAFKDAEGDTPTEPEETPEDFGIDPDTATYKYDTGR